MSLLEGLNCHCRGWRAIHSLTHPKSRVSLCPSPKATTTTNTPRHQLFCPAFTSRHCPRTLLRRDFTTLYPAHDRPPKWCDVRQVYLNATPEYAVRATKCMGMCLVRNTDLPVYQVMLESETTSPSSPPYKYKHRNTATDTRPIYERDGDEPLSSPCSDETVKPAKQNAGPGVGKRPNSALRNHGSAGPNDKNSTCENDSRDGIVSPTKSSCQTSAQSPWTSPAANMHEDKAELHRLVERHIQEQQPPPARAHHPRSESTLYDPFVSQPVSQQRTPQSYNPIRARAQTPTIPWHQGLHPQTSTPSQDPIPYNLPTGSQPFVQHLPNLHPQAPSSLSPAARQALRTAWIRTSARTIAATARATALAQRRYLSSSKPEDLAAWHAAREKLDVELDLDARMEQRRNMFLPMPAMRTGPGCLPTDGCAGGMGGPVLLGGRMAFMERVCGEVERRRGDGAGSIGGGGMEDGGRVERKRVVGAIRQAVCRRMERKENKRKGGLRSAYVDG